MNTPFKNRLSNIVKIGAGTIAAAAVITVTVKGNTLSRGVVVSDSLPSESIAITSEVATPSSDSIEKPFESADKEPSSNSSGEPPESADTAPSAAQVNINTATAEQLQTLPGIGAAKAAAIIAYREQHGNFTDISEITNVSGIGNALFEEIRDRITVGSAAALPSSSITTPPESTVTTPPNSAATAQININTATAEQLQTLPGIGAAKAALIIEYREQHGSFTDIVQITDVSGIGNALFEEIRDRITVGTATAPSSGSSEEPPKSTDNEPSTPTNSSPTENTNSEPTAQININTATAEQLQTLPGIGAAKAAAIIAYREQHGNFTDISEITNVSGIGNALFEEIRDRITVGSAAALPSSSITTPPESTVTTPPNSAATAQININTAIAEQLQTLPGIGAAKAALIIEYREQHGSFTDISEITNVSGIGNALFEEIRDRITVGAAAVSSSTAATLPNTVQININAATAEQLQTLPGIGASKAAAIIEYRDQHGDFTDISEITNVSGIGNATFEKIRDKISV